MLLLERGPASLSSHILFVAAASPAIAQLPVVFGGAPGSRDLPGTSFDITGTGLDQMWVSPNGRYISVKTRTSLGAETVLVYDLALQNAVPFVAEGVTLPASLAGVNVVEMGDVGQPSNAGVTSFSFTDDPDPEEVEMSVIAAYDPVSESFLPIAATDDNISETDFVFGATGLPQELHGEIINSPATSGDGAVLFIDEFTGPVVQSPGLRERNNVSKYNTDEYLFLKTDSSLHVVANSDCDPDFCSILANSFEQGGALFPVPSSIVALQTFDSNDAFGRGNLATWVGSEQPDGTRPFMFKGFTNINLNQDEMIVVGSFDASEIDAPIGVTGVTFDVVYEESVPLPFSAFTLIPPVFDDVDGGTLRYAMDDEGDWGLIGEFDLLSGDVPFAYYNGTVITQVDLPVVAGGSEVWTDLDFITPEQGTGLFALLGDTGEAPISGNWGNTVTYDGEIVLETGDLVDIDGDGVADAEAGNIQSGSIGFGVNSTIYAVVGTRPIGGGGGLGEVVVQIGCPADIDDDGDGDGADVQSFVSLLDVGDIDIDGDGIGDAFDLSTYLLYVTQGCP